MIRAVVDTNVLVSGLLSARGNSRQIINAWLAGRFVMLASSEIIAEALRVLEYSEIRSRISISQETLTDFRLALVTLTERVPGRLLLSGVCRDPHDDMFITCAVEGRAAYIVSNDPDLLTLGSYQDIPIISPARFLEILYADEAASV
jgi:putative PIN family toxin of toxin-antitoxin system